MGSFFDNYRHEHLVFFVILSSFIGGLEVFVAVDELLESAVEKGRYVAAPIIITLMVLAVSSRRRPGRSRSGGPD
jgi:hypothetical protein